GQGSTFWFTAVFDKVEDASLVKAREQVKNACQEISVNFAGSRVLLVEDNEINMIVATGVHLVVGTLLFTLGV
ncbi:hypothetical protein L0N00_18270, partial [Eggerthella lenta]|nr:hypothetical protein [Eggerthella lenta]